MTCSTRLRVSSATPAWPLITRETVGGETPASRAMSATVISPRRRPARRADVTAAEYPNRVLTDCPPTPSFGKYRPTPESFRRRHHGFPTPARTPYVPHRHVSRGCARRVRYRRQHQQPVTVRPGPQDAHAHGVRGRQA